MRTVEIPDPIYEEAASRAAANGQSVDALVLDMLKSYLAEEDEPLRLTPEQLEKIDQAEADIDAGNFYTSEQVDERHAAFRDAWIRENVR